MLSTWRVAVLLLVVAGLVVSWVYPVRTFLSQRSQIHAMQAQVAADTESVAQLQVSSAQWQDPAFIREQARERLRLVAPGETGYIVTDSRSTSPTPVPTPTVSGPAPGLPGQVTATATPRTVPGPGADGLARLGTAVPWWSTGPTPASTAGSTVSSSAVPGSAVSSSAVPGPAVPTAGR